MLAIDEADIILFVVDGKEGLTSNDLAVRDMLLKSNRKVIVVINKCDSKLMKEHEYDGTVGSDINGAKIDEGSKGPNQ